MLRLGLAHAKPASVDATGRVVAWGVLPEQPLLKIIKSQPSPRPPVSKDLRGRDTFTCFSPAIDLFSDFS
ncbi:hypothetical protein Forpi1262_v008981 [Fusarium oxysporum f. sp. raphani]|uniref:Uncharacterized protein n=1 Tax=Fusarium oxysporum f. sp. raphani TaxID=96318 RepID=A0A8J5Q0T2_FUSOX|nr:hypothetical protein Forpi1262_v008981 [Fusarium oxysporum f. sp. raphani]